MNEKDNGGTLFKPMPDIYWERDKRDFRKWYQKIFLRGWNPFYKYDWADLGKTFDLFGAESDD